MKLNLATYVAKCIVELKEPDEIKDPLIAETVELIPKGRLVSKWADFKGQKSSLFYAIAPSDDAFLGTLISKRYSEPLGDDDITIRDDFKKDCTTLHFGKVEVDPITLSALYQEVRDLVDKMKASEKLSPAMNERDRKGYRIKFD